MSGLYFAAPLYQASWTTLHIMALADLLLCIGRAETPNVQETAVAVGYIEA